MNEMLPESNPVLAAATEAILNRRLAAQHSSGDGPGRRAAILLDALPDAAAALQAAAPLIRAAERQRIAALAREMGAAYPVAAGPVSRAAWTETASSFADFLADVPAGGQGCA